jgi:dTDP-4-amino-4,6-dideoxygalactose transaminase
LKVPFFGNHIQYQNLQKQWIRRVDKVWSSGQYFNGKETIDLEERLANLGQRKYAVALGSCSDALKISAQFYSLHRWSVSAFTFISSASSIIRAGSHVHLTSLSSDSYCPKSLQYKNSITKNTEIEGIVHVDLYGSCQHTRDVENYCNENELVLIEDAAQSFGSSFESRSSGSFGMASCLSFDPTKIISGTSAAGALLTDDWDLFLYAKSIRLHGKSENGDFTHIGIKSLMSCAEASIIDLKLNYLEEWVQRRNEIANLYSSSLQSENIIVPKVISGHNHSFHKYVIRVPANIRDTLKKSLLKDGIETRVHYRQDLSKEPALTINNTTQDEPLNLHQNCETVLSLPIYPELTTEQIEYVCQRILKHVDVLK